VLHQLSIKDFVIVSQLELDLGTGLTIVTGETGAGKSILIEALALLLGARADSGVIRQGCAQAELLGRFELTALARAWLDEQGLDSSGDCLLRRVIARNGRSRASINGTQVTVQALAALGERLVDIHSQHAHQSLLSADTQRQLLDGMQQPNSQLQTVTQAWADWKALREALLALGGNQQDRDAQLALLRYQVAEFDKLGVTQADLADLEQEHRRLAHAGQLLESAQTALDLLDDEQGGAALNKLYRASRSLDHAQSHDPRLSPILELLDSALIQAREASEELSHYLAALDVDPQRLEQVEQRIAQLQDLARKHQIRVEQLPAHDAALRAKLDALEHHEQRAAKLEQALRTSLRAYHRAAAQLSSQRQHTADALGLAITAHLQRLGMPHGRLVIAVTPQPEAPPSAQGTDLIQFLVSANPGQPPKPLAKVASGGELSRISLAIQVITAQAGGVGTLVFDEVDVGIGGGVAEIVGRQLAELSRQRQVLCITHLPQVAACGDQQLQVSKTSHDNQTEAHIQRLDPAQRVQEIARMLGGLEITAPTLAHAKEMLAWRTASDHASAGHD